jgi:hypothetical protein
MTEGLIRQICVSTACCAQLGFTRKNEPILASRDQRNAGGSFPMIGGKRLRGGGRAACRKVSAMTNGQV